MRDVPVHLELITPPASEPLEVEFVRDWHLRVASGSAEDDYLLQLIKAARRAGERITRRSFHPQTWALVLDAFPTWEIVVPRPPLRSVTSITYLDEDGVEQTLQGSPLGYTVSTPSGPYAKYGRIRPAYGETWPATRAQQGAVTVTFEAGYDVDGVPEDILQGMLLTVGEFYKQRSESVHAFNQNPALIRARDLFMGYRAY